MPNSYTDVAFLENGEVKCAITKRLSNRGLEQFSYKFFRTYEQNGEQRETVWMNPRHLAPMRQLLEQADEIIAREKTE